jgi:hypothetical protein
MTRTIPEFITSWADSERKGDVRRLGGSPLPFDSVRATLTLVRTDGGWRMAAIHMSLVAGTRGAPPLPATATPGGRRA